MKIIWSYFKSYFECSFSGYSERPSRISQGYFEHNFEGGRAAISTVRTEVLHAAKSHRLPTQHNPISTPKDSLSAFPSSTYQHLQSTHPNFMR